MGCLNNAVVAGRLAVFVGHRAALGETDGGDQLVAVRLRDGSLDLGLGGQGVVVAGHGRIEPVKPPNLLRRKGGYVVGHVRFFAWPGDEDRSFCQLFGLFLRLLVGVAEPIPRFDE